MGMDKSSPLNQLRSGRSDLPVSGQCSRRRWAAGLAAAIAAPLIAWQFLRPAAGSITAGATALPLATATFSPIGKAALFDASGYVVARRRATVASKITGKVGDVSLQEGRMNPLEVQVDVSESFIDRVQPQQPVRITLNAYPDWMIPGSVIAAIPTADRAGATVKVRIAIDQKDARILPDMGAHVSFLGKALPGDAPTGAAGASCRRSISAEHRWISQI